MQGVWILENGAEAHPARTKKEIREVLADPMRGAGHILLERTTPWEYDGLLLLAPRAVDHWFVGPDPLYQRNWFGCFYWNERKSRWEVR